jgi:hypothetical protein
MMSGALASTLLSNVEGVGDVQGSSTTSATHQGKSPLPTCFDINLSTPAPLPTHAIATHSHEPDVKGENTDGLLDQLDNLDVLEAPPHAAKLWTVQQMIAFYESGGTLLGPDPSQSSCNSSSQLREALDSESIELGNQADFLGVPTFEFHNDAQDLADDAEVALIF